jgi:hypothetical protein
VIVLLVASGPGPLESEDQVIDAILLELRSGVIGGSPPSIVEALGQIARLPAGPHHARTVCNDDPISSANDASGCLTAHDAIDDLPKASSDDRD